MSAVGIETLRLSKEEVVAVVEEVRRLAQVREKPAWADDCDVDFVLKTLEGREVEFG